MEEHFFSVAFWQDKFSETTTQVKDALINYVPNIVAAAFILIIGWFIATLSRYFGVKLGQLVCRLIAAIEKRQQIKSIKDVNKFSNVLGAILYWIIFLYFIFFALQVLDLPGITAWLSYFAAMLPHIVSGVIIIFLGFLFGAIARNAIYSGIEKQDGRNPYFIAQSTRYAIIAIFVIWGVEQTGINISILANFVSIIVAAIFGGAALGFGIGASGYVANLVAAYNLKKTFRVGEKVSINDMKGTIIDITNSAIILETEHGLAMIPAKLTNDKMSFKNL